MKGVGVILLQVCLYREELGAHRLAPALPFSEDLERHEVLAKDGGDEHAVLFRYDFFGDAAFFFD